MENSAVPNLSRTCKLALIIRNIVGSLVIIFATIFMIVCLMFSSKNPQFQVDSFSLSNFTLIRNDSAISVTGQVQLTVRNPNDFVTLSFDRSTAITYLRPSWSLGPIVLPPFWLGTKSQTLLTASFAAVVKTHSIVGNVGGFDLRLMTGVRYKERVVGKTRKHVLAVFCDGLVVGFPSNGRPGGLIGGAHMPCRVSISSSPSTF